MVVSITITFEIYFFYIPKLSEFISNNMVENYPIMKSNVEFSINANENRLEWRFIIGKISNRDLFNYKL